MRISTAVPAAAGVLERRSLLKGAASAACVVLAACAKTTSAREQPPHAEGAAEAHGEAEVTPGEDLMQEHGVIERLLLVYEESARRIETATALDLAVVTGATRVVRRFVQDYHEKNEEDFVFPALERARRESELVRVLREQHDAGRRLTEAIAQRAAQPAAPELALLLRSFVRMYRPHAAFEDTRAFPAFRKLFGDAAYRELGERFEDREHERLGKDGFEDAVNEVARLEDGVGIGDLAKFTPAGAASDAGAG